MRFYRSLSVFSLLCILPACGASDNASGARRSALSCTPSMADADGDCRPDILFDNCTTGPNAFNPDQADHDGDLIGDACDPQPGDPTNTDTQALDTDGSAVSLGDLPDPQVASAFSPILTINFDSSGPIRYPAKAAFGLENLPAGSDLTFTVIHRGWSDGNVCTSPAGYSTATWAGTGGCFDVLLSNLGDLPAGVVGSGSIQVPNGAVTYGVANTRKRTQDGAVDGVVLPRCTGGVPCSSPSPGYTTIDGTNVWTGTQSNFFGLTSIPANGYPIPDPTTPVAPATGSLAGLPATVTLNATGLTSSVQVFFATTPATVLNVNPGAGTVTVIPPVIGAPGPANVTIINDGTPQRANTIPAGFLYTP